MASKTAPPKDMADLIARAGTLSNPQGDMADLLNRASNASVAGNAPAWNPNAEKDHPLTVAGVVDTLDALDSTFGRYPVITIDTQDPTLGQDGRLSIHGFHTALKSQLGTVAIGDVLAVTYLGVQEQKSKKDGIQGYENYSVALFNPDGTRKATRRPASDMFEPNHDGATQPTVVGPGGAAPPRFSPTTGRPLDEQGNEIPF